MNTVKKLALASSLIAGLALISEAGAVTQSAGSFSFDWASNETWPIVTLGSVVLETGTNTITDLSATATVVDQGWGNISYPNGVAMVLTVNDVQIWRNYFVGANHDVQTANFSILSGDNAASYSALTGAVASIDWSSSPVVAMSIVAEPSGYPAYELHVSNASFSVTSSVSAVPEPSSYASLCGFATLGFAALRRRKVRA